MICQHFLLSGLVQGVSFRLFTQRQAQKLGLSGKVRNLNDGRVEVLVIGGAEELMKFQQALIQGPRLAKVDALLVKDIAESCHFEGFLIVEDGQKPWFDSAQS